MSVSHRCAKTFRRVAGISAWSLLAMLLLDAALPAADPNNRNSQNGPPTAAAGPAASKATGTATSKATTAATSKAASGTAAPTYRPETELDVSGPYHAQLNSESYPSELEVWGPDAALKIAISAQDKPMLGMFLNNQLKVMFQYGAANFNLTTALEAQYDGRNFNGQYSRADEKLGAKVSPVTLTPDWWHGATGGTPMTLPRQPADIPGTYAINITGNGRSISDQTEVKLDQGAIKFTAGGREYRADFSTGDVFPVFWDGPRMDIFKLSPTTYGYKGKLVKDMGTKEQEFDAELVKGDGNGGGGHERDWTYVYDVIFNNSPPVFIGKLTLREDQATLVIALLKGERAAMKGSLTNDGVLAVTGSRGHTAASVRAQRNPHGFLGEYRSGTGMAVAAGPIILKNRPARVSGAPAW